MSEALPEYYFRTRENGAVVFRVDTENRMGRIEMTQIAVVNMRNGEVKAHGEHVLSDADTDAISDWMAARRAVLSGREIDDIVRLVDRLNGATTWVQQRATADDLDRVSEPLLMAMHDLRSVIARKKSKQD